MPPRKSRSRGREAAPLRAVGSSGLVEPAEPLPSEGGGTAGADGDEAAALAAEICRTAEKMLRDRASVADLKLVSRALKEMRWAFHVFSRYRHIPKVSTFGSARTPEDAPAYRQAREFARRLVERGFMVITGAGPGIMRACQEGSGRARSFGINIRLPFEQHPNEFIHADPKLVNFKYFFTRKLLFVKEADAIALFPGGFGTHDEGFESLTLLQTGKAKPMPIVFIDAPGGTYWQTWHRYVEEHLLGEGLISPSDLRLYRITDDVDEAVEEIVRFYRRYHSCRFVGERLVIRLKEALPPAALRALAEEFADLVVHGEMEQRAALPEERDEPELADLPRLVFAFGKREHGRLRALIDRLNEAEG